MSIYIPNLNEETKEARIIHYKSDKDNLDLSYKNNYKEKEILFMENKKPNLK